MTRLVIESTSRLTTMDGVKVRVWRGTTIPGGLPVMMLGNVVVAPEVPKDVSDAELADLTATDPPIELRKALDDTNASGPWDMRYFIDC